MHVRRGVDVPQGSPMPWGDQERLQDDSMRAGGAARASSRRAKGEPSAFWSCMHAYGLIWHIWSKPVLGWVHSEPGSSSVCCLLIVHHELHAWL